MKQVYQLPDWPPIGGGAFSPTRDKFAISSQEVVIKQLSRVQDDHVVFTCSFERTVLTYDYDAPDAEIAELLGDLLKRHVGMSLSSLDFEELKEFSHS